MEKVAMVCCNVRGNPSTIPAKMIREMPLPIFFSVINSPNHIKKIVPAVIVKTIVINLKLVKELIIGCDDC